MPLDSCKRRLFFYEGTHGLSFNFGVEPDSIVENLWVEIFKRALVNELTVDRKILPNKIKNFLQQTI